MEFKDHFKVEFDDLDILWQKQHLYFTLFQMRMHRCANLKETISAYRELLNGVSTTKRCQPVHSYLKSSIKINCSKQLKKKPLI